MKVWTRVLVFLVLALVVGAAAQERQSASSFKWWQNEKARELGLTADQSNQIEAIFQDRVKKLRACNADLERLERRLSDVIAGDDVPESEVVKLIDQVDIPRSEMSKTRALMLYQMRRVLTPEQRLKLKAIDERERDARRRASDKK